MKKLALALALGLGAVVCGSAKAASVAQPFLAGGFNSATSLPYAFNHNAPDAFNGAPTSASFDIVINPGGSVTVLGGATGFQGEYDEVEDVAINVFNNSGQTLNSLTLTGPNIFGLDGDGIATAPGGASFDATGYAGPGTSFTIFNTSNGIVNFTGGGLASGDYTFFSLEEGTSIVGTSLSNATPNAPLPSTAWTGLALLAGVGLLKYRRRAVAL